MVSVLSVQISEWGPAGASSRTLGSEAGSKERGRVQVGYGEGTPTGATLIYCKQRPLRAALPHMLAAVKALCSVFCRHRNKW